MSKPPSQATMLRELRRREAIIYESGDNMRVALREIREDKWYKAICRTWDEYCERYLGAGHRTIDRIIEAENVWENIRGVVENGTHVSQKLPSLTRPSDRALREMSDLPPEEQREVAAQLVESGDQVTSKSVSKARAASGKPPKARKPQAQPDDTSERDEPPVTFQQPQQAPSTLQQAAEAVTAIRRACKAAAAWDDDKAAEARSLVADELRKWLGKLAVDAEQLPAKSGKTFKPPTIEEVAGYVAAGTFKTKQNGQGEMIHQLADYVDPHEFFERMQGSGWTRIESGKRVKLQNWKMHVHTFARNRLRWDRDNPGKQPSSSWLEAALSLGGK